MKQWRQSKARRIRHMLKIGIEPDAVAAEVGCTYSYVIQIRGAMVHSLPKNFAMAPFCSPTVVMTVTPWKADGPGVVSREIRGE